MASRQHICTEVDSVNEDTACGILDITTEPGTNSSDAEAYVIEEVEVYICHVDYTCVYSYILDKWK